MILGADASHYQGAPNWLQVKASGRDFCVLKATEGTSYADPAMAANRESAHAADLIVGLYHFSRAGDAAAEARYFLKTIGALQPGEALVLDWEVPGSNPPGWCKTWLDTVYQATGVRPLVYMNQSAVTGFNWSAVAADYGLWLAKYDNAPAAFTSVPYWGAPAMKQYSDKGTVPGIGTCDVDSFNGTAEQLLAYGYQGADVALTQADANLIANTLLDTPIPRQGSQTGSTSLRATIAWLDSTLTQILNPSDAYLKLINRAVLCLTPDDRPGVPWLVDMAKGTDDKSGEIADAVKQLQSAGVDPAQVAALVLAGIKAQMAAPVPPAS